MSASDPEYRTPDAKRYALNGETIRMQGWIKYYNRKRRQGADWRPRETSKLSQHCRQRGLDPLAVIEGTQQLPSDG
jgi:hypothetical protein